MSVSAGLPVVCIPGLTRNSLDYEDVAPWLAGLGRHVIAVDLRGRGRSQAGDPAGYRLPVYVNDVLALIDRMGFDRVHILGTSLGGMVAMQMARSHLSRLAGAVLNDIGPDGLRALANLHIAIEALAALALVSAIVFETRYLMGDAAHHCGRPLVFGGAVRMEGQVSVFQSSVKGHFGSPCYRCVFPSMPDAKQAPGCSEAGILGPIAGLIGTLQALETIKLILGQPRTLTGRLLLIEGADGVFTEIQTVARLDCSCCGKPTNDLS